MELLAQCFMQFSSQFGEKPCTERNAETTRFEGVVGFGFELPQDDAMEKLISALHQVFGVVRNKVTRDLIPVEYTNSIKREIHFQARGGNYGCKSENHNFGV